MLRTSTSIGGSLAVLLLLWGSGSATAEDEPEAAPARSSLTIEEGTLVWRLGDRKQVVDVGCQPLAALVVGESGYVACREGRVVALALGGERARVMWTARVPGRAVGLFAVDGVPWVRFEREQALPVASLERGGQPGAPPPVTAQPTAPEPGAVGRVLAVTGATAVVDIGREHGLARGDLVELYSEETLDLGDGETAVRENRLAVVEVMAASAQRAELRLGQNERALVGSRARETSASRTESRYGPPRLGDLWTASFTVRPFLALGTLGAGSVNEAAVVYQMARPVTIEALFHPIGLGVTEDRSTFTGALSVVPSYDTRYFQIGLGVGGAKVVRTVGGDDPAPSDNPRWAFAVSQIARLGSRDGIHLRVENTFVLYEGEFRYGGTTGTAQTPIGSSSRLWLLGRGGGSFVGYGFGEIGLRVRARGNGDRGSLYLTPSLGGAVLMTEERVDCRDGSGDRCVESEPVAGPMVGFGMEWRL